jgi:hypothetical protein
MVRHERVWEKFSTIEENVAVAMIFRKQCESWENNKDFKNVREKWCEG